MRNMSMISNRCNICGRKLDVSADLLLPTAAEIAGAALGAMELGWPESAKRVAKEIRAGLREPDGAAKPPPEN